MGGPGFLGAGLRATGPVSGAFYEYSEIVGSILKAPPPQNVTSMDLGHVLVPATFDSILTVYLDLQVFFEILHMF